MTAVNRRTLLKVSGAVTAMGLVGCDSTAPNPDPSAAGELPGCLARVEAVEPGPPGDANLPRETDPLPNHLVASSDAEPKLASVVPLAGQGPMLRIWSLASGRLLPSYPVAASAVLRWQTGRGVVVWPEGSEVALLDVATGRLGWLGTRHAKVELPTGTGAVFSAAADPELLVSAGYDDTVRVHALASCAEKRRFEIDESVLQADLLADGSVLVLHRSGLSLAGPDDTELTMVAPADNPNAFVHSAGVVVVVRNWSARVYSADWRPGVSLEWPDEALVGGTISADGALFAGCLPQAERLLIFDTTTGQYREVVLPSSSQRAVFGADGGLYTIHLDEGIIGWDPATGAELRRFELPG